jgi:hypothetical protein
MTKAMQMRLREAMAAAKPPIKSVAEFGRRCSLPDSTARAYLNGRRSPPLKVCRKIGAALSIDGDWLYYGDDAPKEAAPAPPRALALVFAAVEEALLTCGLLPGRAAKIAAVVRLVLSVQHHPVIDMTPEDVVRWTVRRDVELLLASGA